MRAARGIVAALLAASGILMYVASHRRWAKVCGWGETGGDPCLARQDHRYDFLLPSDPWQPVAGTAQLAGCSVLLFAVALLLLPAALGAGRPRLLLASAAVAAVPTVDGAVATLRSGTAGEVVPPLLGTPSTVGWLLLTPVLLVVLAFRVRGAARVAVVALVLSTPLVGGLTYGIGPYDARPWYEGMSGALIVVAAAAVVWAGGGVGFDTARSSPAQPAEGGLGFDAARSSPAQPAGAGVGFDTARSSPAQPAEGRSSDPAQPAEGRAAQRSRSRERWTLPDGGFGSAATKCTARG